MWLFERLSASHHHPELPVLLEQCLERHAHAEPTTVGLHLTPATHYQVCIYGFTPQLMTEGTHYLNYWLHQLHTLQATVKAENTQAQNTVETLHIIYHKGLKQFIHLSDYGQFLELIEEAWHTQHSNLPLCETWYQVLEQLIHSDNKAFSAQALAYCLEKLPDVTRLVVCNPTNMPQEALAPWWQAWQKRTATQPLPCTFFFDTPDTFRVRHQQTEVRSLLKLLHHVPASVQHHSEWLCSSSYMQALLQEHWHHVQEAHPTETSPPIQVVTFYEPLPQPLGVRHTPTLEAPIKIGVLHHPAWGKESASQLDTLFTQLSPQRVYEDMPFHLYRLHRKPFESLTQLACHLYELQLDIVILWPDTPLGSHVEALAVQASGASLITHAQAGSIAHSVLSEELKGKVMLNLDELEQWLAVPDTIRGLRAIHTPQAVAGFQFKPRAIA